MTLTVSADGDVAQVNGDLERLRRAALERPDDLATHLVYADALMEVGDPLGEVMRRQCADPAVEAPYDVARRLLGRLYPYVERWRVVRGFLREVRLRRVTPRNFRRAAGRPEWEGVTSISFARGRTVRTSRLPAPAVVDLLSHPVCRSVREVLDLDDETLRRLAGAPRSFERVSTNFFHWRRQPGDPIQLKVRMLEFTSDRQVTDAIGWLLADGRPLFDSVSELLLPDPGYLPLSLLPVAGPQLRRLDALQVHATRDGERWRVLLTPPWFPPGGLAWDLPVLEEAIRDAVPCSSSLEVQMPDYGPAVLDRVRLAARDLDFTLTLTGPAEPWLSGQGADGDADSPF